MRRFDRQRPQRALAAGSARLLHGRLLHGRLRCGRLRHRVRQFGRHLQRRHRLRVLRRLQRRRLRHRIARRHDRHFVELRDQLDVDLGAAGGHEPELRCRGVRQVDDAPVQERAAIVDANDDAAAVGNTRDAHVARYRQRRMRRGHRVHVVAFAARCRLAVVAPSVPRSGAAYAIRRQFGHRRVGAAEHRVRAQGARQQRLGAGHRVGNRGEIRRCVLARPVVEVVGAAPSGRCRWLARRSGFARARARRLCVRRRGRCDVGASRRRTRAEQHQHRHQQYDGGGSQPHGFYSGTCDRASVRSSRSRYSRR